MPAWAADRQRRRERIRAAKAQLEAKAATGPGAHDPDGPGPSSGMRGRGGGSPAPGAPPPNSAQRDVTDPDSRIQAHPDLAQRLRFILSVPSAGDRTALALLIRRPELGTPSRSQAASLAGLAPFVRQSGKWQGQAWIGSGRSGLRRSLFAAAFAGAHHGNKALMQLRDRLRARGACRTSAATACARKLLIQVNAVVARGTPWEEPSQVPA